MAIVAQLVATGVPSTDTIGGMPMVIYHVKVSPAGGAGTYTFLHGLPYTPTAVVVVPEIAQGTTPTILVGYDVADTTSTLVAFNVNANATCDVYYG